MKLALGPLAGAPTGRTHQRQRRHYLSQMRALSRMSAAW